ncbi:MAG: hypothetical protein IBJ15_00185 [Alphaproteobacteria bacterium]|nr:hypothetical protein [Alphaproteobacteria bacterium]
MTFPIEAWRNLVDAGDRRPLSVSFDGLTLRVWTAASALAALLLGLSAAPFPLWFVAAVCPAVALGFVAGSRGLRSAATANLRPAWAAGNGIALAAVSFWWIALGTAMASALQPAIGVSGSLGLMSLSDFGGFFAAGAAIAAERRRG